MKIAANLSLLFGELPLAERVLAARVAGFDGVEIQFPMSCRPCCSRGCSTVPACRWC